MTPLELRARFQALKTASNPARQQWEDVSKYVFPFRGDPFREISSEGEVDWELAQDYQYDSTASEAAFELSAGLHGKLTSPDSQWFALGLTNKKLAESEGVTEWLKECTDVVWHHLQASNFYSEIPETYLDLVGYGASILFEEESDDPKPGQPYVAFSSQGPGEAYIDRDHAGNVAGIYREHRWTASQMASKFGLEALPAHLAEEISNPERVTTTHTVIYAVYENRDYRPPANPDKPVPPELRPVLGRYVIEREAEPIGELIGYFEMPGFAPRWHRMRGSVWGYSPVMRVMATIKALNKFEELVERATAKSVDPPLIAEEDQLVSDWSWEPGTVNIVSDLKRIGPAPQGTNWPAVADREANYRATIENALMVSLLRLRDTPNMTAQEVRIRYRMMLSLLGSVLTRLQAELFAPIVYRTFAILRRAKQLPDAPAAVETGEHDLEVRYVGPLAAVQQQEETNALDEAVATIGQMAAVWPEAADLLDVDAAIRARTEAMDVPSDMLNSRSVVVAKRNARQAQMRAAAHQEQMTRAGQAMEALGKGANAVQEAQANGANVGQPGPAKAGPGNGPPQRPQVVR